MKDQHKKYLPDTFWEKLTQTMKNKSKTITNKQSHIMVKVNKLNNMSSLGIFMIHGQSMIII